MTMRETPVMPPARLDRRSVVLGSAMLGAAAVTQMRMPREVAPAIGEAEFKAMVPDRIGNWQFENSSGLVLPPSDALSDRLYDNLLTRVYGGPDGSGIMLLIAYNPRQDGVLQIHRPEFCYEAAGFALTQRAPIQVAMAGRQPLTCQAFTAIGHARDEVVAYWTRVGASFPGSWTEQRLSVARSNLEGTIPDGMLARVSLVSDDRTRALPILGQFIAELYARSGPRFRNLLFA